MKRKKAAAVIAAFSTAFLLAGCANAVKSGTEALEANGIMRRPPQNFRQRRMMRIRRLRLKGTAAWESFIMRPETRRMPLRLSKCAGQRGQNRQRAL